MDIVSYLLEILETKKIVGITALGTLYKKKTPGRYDVETHSFLPPKHEIAFTDEVKEEEELVNFICEKRNISEDSAKFYITEFVENIHAQLTDQQQADIHPIGQLKRINDQVILEFSDPIEVDHTFFGLPIVTDNQTTELPAQDDVANEAPILNGEKETDNQPVFDKISEFNDIQANNELEERVDIEPESPDEFFHEKTDRVEIEEPSTHIEENKETANIAENAKEAPLSNDILDPLWKPTVISRYEYDEEEEEQASRWPKVLLKIFLTLVIIAAFAFAVIYFLYPNLLQKINNSPSEQPQIEAPAGGGGSVKVDSGSNTEKKIAIAQDTVKKNVVFTSSAEDSLKKPMENVVIYEVIGSAMKTQKKVDEVISNLSKRGIIAKQMDAMPGRLIKVSLGTFTNYNLAKKFQDSVKIKLRNPEIYIQTIKPKN